MTEQWTEKELLDLARKYSFRSRLDRNTIAGPVMVWGRGSVVRDVNGKEYLDFNSGQMCAALGHNHPRITQALQESCQAVFGGRWRLACGVHSVLAKMFAQQFCGVWNVLDDLAGFRSDPKVANSRSFVLDSSDVQGGLDHPRDVISRVSR